MFLLLLKLRTYFWVRIPEVKLTFHVLSQVYSEGLKKKYPNQYRHPGGVTFFCFGYSSHFNMRKTDL
jgi:hypothetical protein